MTDAVDTAAPAADAAPPAADQNPADPADKAAEPQKGADPSPEPDKGGKAPEKGADPLASGNDPDPKSPAPQKWPDDWRQQIAGDDKKALERLSRYDGPAAVAKALMEAQDKIRSGLKPKERPGEKATEEEIASYRKEAGIPETVDDYVAAIELPDKRQIGDEDKPVIAAFAERAHKMNLPPKDMAGLVDEYYAIQEEQAVLRAEKDADFKAASMQALREEYGGEFKANINAMRPYFESVDSELFDNLMGGRLADGSKVGDHPAIVKFFVAKALQENPAATIVPAGGNQVETIEAEIKALTKRMGEDRDAWFKDAAAQKRLQQLYDAQEKLGGKK
ncbi:MAG: hypothetical protein AB7O39_03185 [Flavobacteriaceae bacterium]